MVSINFVEKGDIVPLPSTFENNTFFMFPKSITFIVTQPRLQLH